MRRRRRRRHLLLCAVQLPERSQLACVFGRVRVAEHHLVLAAVHVRRRREDALHHGRCRLQVFAGLEERRDAHGRRDAGDLLQQRHREHVGGVVGHRDDVRAEALRRQLREGSEGVEDLEHVGRRGEVGGARAQQQRAARLQLGLEPRAALRLVPREEGAEAQVGGERIERLRVPLRLLAHVERREAETEGLDAADQIEQRAWDRRAGVARVTGGVATGR
jgi:hypothetical protein